MASQQPVTITRIRRMSKTALISEATSPAPRLDRMVAHGSVFDKASRYMMDDLDVSGKTVQSTTSTWSSKQRPSVKREPQSMVAQIKVAEVEILDDD